MDLKETELTLGMPGKKPPVQGDKLPVKRGFSDAGLDLKLGDGGSSGKKPGFNEVVVNDNDYDEQLDRSSTTSKPPSPKEELIGWPPVRASRKNAMKSNNNMMSKYVKVALDGAPFLRKLDLQLYTTYQQLLKALDHLFSCNLFNEGKLIDPINGSEFVPTYEDKDGDWMMVGDTPWKMFVESCQRIRLMKGSEAIGLEPRTPSKVD